MNAHISCTEASARIANGALVIDVMTPEDFAGGHLAGARNACIYEMVFLERIAECGVDQDSELIVYDATGTTRAAVVARERLLASGYRRVSILAGGLAAWRAAGLPLEPASAGALPPVALQDGSYRIDLENSRLEWIGRNLNNRHYGRIAVQGGELVIANGSLVAGSIVLDMRTIANLDLQDPDWRELLQRHLLSDDFFAVERFPTAGFTLRSWQPAPDSSAEAPKGVFAGDLTIRDVTRPISYPATVAPQPDGSIKAHAAFDIDRTLWGVSYGSCRLFERLGMHLVADLISLELFVVASRT